MRQRVLIAIAVALRARARHRRRADQRARRHRAAPHPRPHRRAATRARHGGAARHPRPRRRRRARRAHRRHAARPHRRAGPDRGAARRPGRGLHPSTGGGCPGPRRARRSGTRDRRSTCATRASPRPRTRSRSWHPDSRRRTPSDAGREPFRAVDDVSFRVLRGTTHAIVGESGSGKTTTARIVSRFVTPDAGRVELGGTDVTRLTGAAKRDVPPARAARVPEPVRVARSAADGRRDRRRAAAQLRRRRPRRAPSAARRPLDRVALPAELAARRPARAARAASGSASPSPGRSRSNPSSWCSTRRSPRSTSPCRPDPRAARAAAGRARPELPLHLPRPRGRAAHQPLGVGHAPRPHRGERARPSRSSAPRSTTTPGNCSTPCPETEGDRMTRIGFFTRLLDEAPPAERYRIATEQIVARRTARLRLGLGRAAPLPRRGGRAAVAVRVPRARRGVDQSRIRLGTGVVTLPLEDPVRVAEDAVVLDLLSGGRAELGLGSGSTPASFLAFGERLGGSRPRLRREARRPGRGARGRRARRRRQPPAAAGPRPARRASGRPRSRRSAAPAPAARGTASCSRARSRGPRRHQPDRASAHALRAAAAHHRRVPRGAARRGAAADPRLPHALRRRLPRRGAPLGRARTPPRGGGLRPRPASRRSATRSTSSSRRTTPTSARSTRSSSRSPATRPPREATEVAFQVHSVDPPHELVLRSIELIATEVAPALGWGGVPAANGAELAASAR